MVRNAEASACSLDAPEAFVEIFDLHFDAVHRYVHRRAGADVADEIAAETFAVAFARRETFSDRGNGVLPWLLGIATNLLPRRIRLEERRRAHTLEPASTPGQWSTRTPPPIAPRHNGAGQS